MDEDRFNALEEDVKAVRQDVRELREDWAKARGLVAGVVLTVSAIAGIISSVIAYIGNRGGN